MQAKGQQIKIQETASTALPVIMDSVVYDIPKISRLCDNLKIQGNKIDIGDCELYYETEGSGTPLVIINGGPGGTHHYFHPWFSAIKNDFKIIYYDQRGCGLSDFKPGNGYSFEQAVDDLEKLRKALQIRKWVVVGYSYGGAVAQFYTVKYPENLIATILISAHPLITDTIALKTQQNLFISTKEKDKISAIYRLYGQKKINIQQLIYNNLLNGDWKRQHYYKPTTEDAARTALYEWVNDKGFNAAVGSDMSMYDFKKAFEGNPVPTLLCEGKHDLTWGNKKADLIKGNHPTAQFAFFENSAHDIYADEPALFFLTLKNFLEKANSPPKKSLLTWKKYTSGLLDSQFITIANTRTLISLVKVKGAAEAKKKYVELKAIQQSGRIFIEVEINDLGQSLIRNGKIAEAVEVFTMVTEEFSNSSTAFESLADAYSKNGDKMQAVKNYKQSLALNPDNTNVKEKLKILE